jgi:radical SAM protein (TIGR01212 family)
MAERTEAHPRYRTYRSYLRKRYGVPVYRVGVDAGFSCPNRSADRSGGCTYCDDLGATAVYHRKSEQSLERTGDFIDQVASHIPDRYARMQQRLTSMSDQIERGIQFLQRRYAAEKYLLYFQAYSNTFAPAAQLKQIYDRALSIAEFTELIIATRPDCIDKKRIDLIASYRQGLSDVWVELGLQSPSDATLSRINRGHTVEQFIDAFRMLKAAGIKVSVHLLFSLPDEGYEQIDQAADLMRELKPEAVKIHNLHIPSGTQMYREYLCGEITAASTRRHVSQVIRFLERIDPEIIIQRLTCDTPSHRLAAPRSFAPKGAFVSQLQKTMERRDTWQGRLV